MAHSWELLTHSWSLIHALHSMLISAYPLLFVMFLACVNIFSPSNPYLFVILICSFAIRHTYLTNLSICSPPTWDVNLFSACVYVSCCTLIFLSTYDWIASFLNAYLSTFVMPISLPLPDYAHCLWKVGPCHLIFVYLYKMSFSIFALHLICRIMFLYLFSSMLSIFVSLI